MRKMPTIFVRESGEQGRRLVTDEVNPECLWVFKGEGLATRKWDGTCCMVRDGKLYKRYTLKPGKTQPEGFEPTGEPAEGTGKQPGWVPVGDGKADRWHRGVLPPLHVRPTGLPNGTYELCGPHFQGNPEKLVDDMLLTHGLCTMGDVPRMFDGLRDFLRDRDIEGVVFYHPDGRMAKIKGTDFGFSRPG